MTAAASRNAWLMSDGSWAASRQRLSRMREKMRAVERDMEDGGALRETWIEHQLVFSHAHLVHLEKRMDLLLKRFTQALQHRSQRPQQAPWHFQVSVGTAHDLDSKVFFESHHSKVNRRSVPVTGHIPSQCRMCHLRLQIQMQVFKLNPAGKRSLSSCAEHLLKMPVHFGLADHDHSSPLDGCLLEVVHRVTVFAASLDCLS